MELGFVVFFVFLVSLCFRSQQLPAEWIEQLAGNCLPSNLVLRLDSASFGLRQGLFLRGVRVFDTEQQDPLRILAGADSVTLYPLSRHLEIVGARYPRLPDSYYAPGNQERNAPLEWELPELGRWTLSLVGGDILSVRPETLTATVTVTSRRLSVDEVHLVWPDRDQRMSLTGGCRIDLERQELTGECRGLARQANIRPLIETLDLPSTLPYIDAFTEVPGAVPAGCEWKVNLVNNDFDMDLDLRPTLGKYNAVSMKRAEGKIHLHVYTRGNSLNYRQTIGPIHGVGLKDQPLDGTVIVTGTNGYNTVDIEAKSALPLADLLKIGGFTGDYVGEDIFGDSECRLQFRFPRSMTNNYEVLNGHGRFKVTNGHLMRMKGFRGLLAAMPAVAPGISWLTDSTQAAGSYRIENGVVKVEDFYLEGTLFSIKMYGQFDAVRNQLDFIVRVQFTRKDSMLGKVLHPLTWPFTKLLLEFKLEGTPEHPTWTYLSVVHRLLEVVQ